MDSGEGLTERSKTWLSGFYLGNWGHGGSINWKEKQQVEEVAYNSFGQVSFNICKRHV